MLDFDPVDRAAFRAALLAHLAAAFPGAAIAFDLMYDRQLCVTFPDGVTRSIWEPNFYFCRGEHFSDEVLFAMAVQHLSGAADDKQADN